LLKREVGKEVKMRPIILINLEKHAELIQRVMNNWAVCKILSICAFITGRALLAGLIIINWIGGKK